MMAERCARVPSSGRPPRLAAARSGLKSRAKRQELRYAHTKSPRQWPHQPDALRHVSQSRPGALGADCAVGGVLDYSGDLTKAERAELQNTVLPQLAAKHAGISTPEDQRSALGCSARLADRAERVGAS